MSRALDRWMFAGFPSKVECLAIYRIMYAFQLLLSLPRGMWLRDVPDIFFNPPISLAAFFDAFPPIWVIHALNAILVVAAAGLLVGYRTAMMSVMAGIAMILIRTWEYAPGKINHDILFVIIPLVLAGSGWGNRISLDARRINNPVQGPNPGAWALTLLASVIGVAMGTAGWAKLKTGWLDLESPAVIGHLVPNYYVTGRPTWAADLILDERMSIFWEPMDWATVILELGFFPAIFFPRAFLTLLAFASIFHLGVWMMFDITFWINIVAYGAFLPYSATPLPKWAGIPFQKSSILLSKVPGWILFLMGLSLASAWVYLRWPWFIHFVARYNSPILLTFGPILGFSYLTLTGLRVSRRLRRWVAEKKQFVHSK